MKGPYGRLRFDVRRLWECPRCGRFERTGGAVVTLPCHVCGQTEDGAVVWMKLIEAAAPPAQPDPSGTA
jgi:hypothetical protein